jgi:hypothetical protein
MRIVCLVWLVAAGCAQEANLGNTPFQDQAAWSLALGGRGYESGKAIAIDSHGDVVVGGDGYEGTIDFGSGAIGNLGRWAFVAKRSGSNGAGIWERAITGVETGASVDLMDIALASDELAIVGDLAGELLIGPTAITAHGTNDTDALVTLIPPKN